MRFVFVWFLLAMAVSIPASASTLTFTETPLIAPSAERSAGISMAPSDMPYSDSFPDKEAVEGFDFPTVRAGEEFSRFLALAGNALDDIGVSLDRFGRQIKNSDDLSAVAGISSGASAQGSRETTPSADPRLANEHSGLALINSGLCPVFPGPVLSMCRIPY
jgi:hypothetical protein